MESTSTSRRTSTSTTAFGTKPPHNLKIKFYNRNNLAICVPGYSNPCLGSPGVLENSRKTSGNKPKEIDVSWGLRIEFDVEKPFREACVFWKYGITLRTAQRLLRWGSFVWIAACYRPRWPTCVYSSSVACTQDKPDWSLNNSQRTNIALRIGKDGRWLIWLKVFIFEAIAIFWFCDYWILPAWLSPQTPY